MTTTEKLIKTVQNMPEPMLAELLDFAEFLPGDPLVIQKRLRDECA